MSRRILVWDLPTRYFHWLLAASFLGAWWISESERWRLTHAMLGYGVCALIGFRLIWGLIGTRHARFSSLPLAPGRVIAYLQSYSRRKPERHIGHNPLGSWGIVILLGLSAVTGISGWAAYTLELPEWMIEMHGIAANTTLAMVGVHLIGVISSSLAHRENLVAAMLHGRKRGAEALAIASARRPIAWALLGLLAALWLGWIPLPGMQPGMPLAPWSAFASHEEDTSGAGIVD